MGKNKLDLDKFRIGMLTDLSKYFGKRLGKKVDLDKWPDVKMWILSIPGSSAEDRAAIRDEMDELGYGVLSSKKLQFTVLEYEIAFIPEPELIARLGF